MAELNILSKKQVREQLADLGYSNVPDNVLNEFMADLLYLTSQRESQSPQQKQKRTPIQTQKQKQQKNIGYGYRQPPIYMNNDRPHEGMYQKVEEEEEEEEEEHQHFSRPVTRGLGFSSVEDDEIEDFYSPPRRKSKAKAPAQVRPHTTNTTRGSRYSYYGHNPKSQMPRKTDPVALYHKRNNTWKKDRYIKRMEAHVRPLSVLGDRPSTAGAWRR